MKLYKKLADFGLVAILKNERNQQFVEWFGETVKAEDCDPAIFIINYFFDRFEFNREQKYWLCWIYGNTYHFPTAYIIWNEFPDMELVGLDRLKDWNDKNYKRLRYQVDTKWNKGHLPEMFQSYKNWVGNSSQHDRFQSLLTGNEQQDFETLWKEAKSLHKFGRYMSWFYLQVLKHCAGVKINPTSLMLEDYEGSRSHRNGLCYAIGKDNLINVKLNNEQVVEFSSSAEELLAETKSQYPGVKNKLDYFAMETALCSFKKLFRIHRGRYLGYYLDRQAEEIKQVEKDGWIGINWEPLWQARRETILSKFLNGSIDKEKMKLFLEAHPQKSKSTLIYIAGLPVTGKTTLLRNIRQNLGSFQLEKNGLLNYENYPNHIVLGSYEDNSTFAGTDKLSMAVNKDAIEFLKKNSKPVIVEGDRLLNSKFLDAAISSGYEVKLLVCQVDTTEEILNRYKQRGKMQSMTFIKGRDTKLKNMIKQYPFRILNTTRPLDSTEIKSLIN